MKGFLLTIDVIMAIVLVGTVISVAYMAEESASDSSFIEIGEHRLAEDVASVLIKTQTLNDISSMNYTDGNQMLYSSLSSILPEGVGANVTVWVFNDVDDDGIFDLGTPSNYSSKYPPSWSSDNVAYAKSFFSEINKTDYKQSKYFAVDVRLGRDLR